MTFAHLKRQHPILATLEGEALDAHRGGERWATWYHARSATLGLFRADRQTWRVVRDHLLALLTTGHPPIHDITVGELWGQCDWDMDDRQHA